VAAGELHDPDDTSGGFTSERAAPQSRYPPNDDGDSAVADGTKRPAPARLCDRHGDRQKERARAARLA